MKTKTIDLSQARGQFHTRKIITNAGMSSITFPKIWSENKEWLQAGKKVRLRLNADNTITIKPMHKLPKEVFEELEKSSKKGVKK